MFRSGFILPLITGILLASCTNQEKETDPDAVYFDYMVSGDEENGHIITKLQYRLGGRNGDPFRLRQLATVALDGEAILPDSTAFNGVYYEVISAADDFAGPHTIEFTDRAGTKYDTEFDFPVFFLKKELPEIIDRNDLEIELAGLDSAEEIRVILTDTSFYGRGVEKTDNVKTGRVLLTAEELKDLRNGPVHLQLIYEEERRLFPGINKGGRLYLSYSLQREFILQDSVFP